ncbi:MAG: hypothetical protein GDA45_01910 [Chromatiales bacterium]|nr:hypothetical protein [Chromatiales bacterium]
MLKKNFPLSTISELTGLSDADINRLKE